jgi:hypothetical protein
LLESVRWPATFTIDKREEIDVVDDSLATQCARLSYVDSHVIDDDAFHMDRSFDTMFLLCESFLTEGSSQTTNERRHTRYISLQITTTMISDEKMTPATDLFDRCLTDVIDEAQLNSECRRWALLHGESHSFTNDRH